MRRIVTESQEQRHPCQLKRLHSLFGFELRFVFVGLSTCSAVLTSGGSEDHDNDNEERVQSEANGDESRGDATSPFMLPFDTREVRGKVKFPSR